MLFIDANRYLGFYNCKHSEFKKIIPALIEIKDDIIITEQIVNEVKRNKLEVALNSLIDIEKKYITNRVNIPVQLADEEKLIIEWNKKEIKCAEQLYANKKELVDLVESISDKIMRSNDQVSILLNDIFNSSIPAENEIIKKAHLRHRLGYPPGKFNDPLGDQVSWEILLEKIININQLWIITNDGDFISKFNNKAFLNPFLYDEIIKVKPDLEIFCFITLSEAIKHYNGKKEEKINNIPKEEDFEKIIEDEREILSFISNDVGLNCINCGGKLSYRSGYPAPSRYGAWTYQYRCSNCLCINDFGEPFDE